MRARFAPSLLLFFVGVFAVAAPAAAQPIPQLALWESQMISYGQSLCDYLASGATQDSKLQNVYYDAIRVFYQIADYTGNSAWNTCAQRARSVYRDHYVLTAACWPSGFGCVPGYWNFTHGERMDFERTADGNSKSAVLSQALNAAYSTDADYNAPETQSAWLSREEAYGLMAHLNAERLGAAPRASTPQIAEKNFAYMDQWFGSKSFRCPSICDPAAAKGQYYIQPFMVGLTAEALIMWFDKTGDARVLPALRQAMDWLWANAWVAGDQSFWYENWVPTPATPFPAQPGAPDLNLLIAPAFAWIYKQTGDTTYRDRGDQVFAGGVLNAFLGNGKQFDQNYKWSFEYVRLRSVTDATAPVVAMTAPASGATVSGSSVSVSASASDDVAVVGVQFKLDGANLGAEKTAAPWAIAWNTSAVTAGAHTLTAVARDAAGNRTTSAALSVTVAGDTTPPTVSITAPTAGISVSGAVTVTATAADNVGVAGVQFKLDGANLGAEVTTAPYTTSWTTTTATNAAHALMAVARDAAGNRTTSSTVSVTVVNDTTPPAVSITAPAGGTSVAATVSVTAAATDNVGVAGVQFKLDGVNLGTEVTTPPYTVSWLTTAASPGAHALTAVARDAAGNRTTSAPVSVTVAGGDTTPPTVAVTGPSAGASVGGSVSVTATAADNVGVAGVQFQLDGVNLGTEVTIAPYSVSWTTTATTNATHALTAVARDAAGNRTTSTAVNVTVANGGGGSSSLTTGLVGYWPFDEGGGSTASDASGSGNTGTLVSGPVWTAGRRGSALAFDGVASYVRVASTPALNSYPLTVAFWMKTASISGVGGLVNKYADLSLNGWQVYMNAGRLCAWYLKDGANYVDDGGTCPLGVSGFNDNQWHQVAFVVDATGGKLYVDGVLRTSLGWAGTPGAPSTTQELRIGQYPGLSSGGFFAGVIDDVRIWDPALSAADILALYTGAGDTTPPTLSAVSVSGVSSSAATMSWTSNKAADTQIVYGPTAALGNATALNPALVTSHSQGVSGLAAATTYHYQVKSRDAAGNLAVSADLTFSTPAAAAPQRKHKKRSWLSDLFGGLF